MKECCVARAKIKNTEIKINDYNKAVLDLVIESTKGTAVYTVSTEYTSGQCDYKNI